MLGGLEDMPSIFLPRWATVDILCPDHHVGVAVVTEKEVIVLLVVERVVALNAEGSKEYIYREF